MTYINCLVLAATLMLALTSEGRAVNEYDCLTEEELQQCTQNEELCKGWQVVLSGEKTYKTLSEMPASHREQLIFNQSATETGTATFGTPICTYMLNGKKVLIAKKK